MCEPSFITCLLMSYVKAEKCEFHVHKIAFLGYHIGLGVVTMDNRKVRAVTEWPETKTVTVELQCFLGFANFYRNFIKNFSTVAEPLTSLLKGKPKILKVTSAARAAFEQLKEQFKSAPVLKLPDPSKPIIVETDASEVGLGGVLLQYHGAPRKLHPCAFFSKKLT